MNHDDHSSWPVDVGAIRFEGAAEDQARADEVTIVESDGTVLASLFPLLPDECAVDACDGRDTTIPVPEGSWEVTVYGRDGAPRAVQVLARMPAADEDRDALTPSVRTWAVMSVLWALSPTWRAYG